jgi:hypothetical protein
MCAAGAAARQAHLLHEGEGAPRVARPVQALGGPVRPAAAPPPPALVAVPVLRCCMCVCTPRQARVVMGQNSSAVARAQGRVEHRARGIAGGGQLAQPEETVSTLPRVEP